MEFSICHAQEDLAKQLIGSLLCLILQFKRMLMKLPKYGTIYTCSSSARDRWQGLGWTNQKESCREERFATLTIWLYKNRLVFFHSKKKSLKSYFSQMYNVWIQLWKMQYNITRCSWCPQIYNIHMCTFFTQANSLYVVTLLRKPSLCFSFISHQHRSNQAQFTHIGGLYSPPVSQTTAKHQEHIQRSRWGNIQSEAPVTSQLP